MRKPGSPTIQRALEFLRQFRPDQLNSTYAISLQTMVFAAAEPVRDRNRILANVEFLERGQIKLGDRTPWPGILELSHLPMHPGDNSNTQYALLGLNAAREAGVTVRPEVWMLSRTYFELSQNRDGGWGYTPRHKQSTASMTCAGISSLILTGSRRYESLEHLQGETIRDCGKGGYNPNLARGIDWLANHFDVKQNFGNGQQWKFYYLYALERAGRLAGVRFFGQNDWYRLGAEEIVQRPEPALRILAGRRSGKRAGGDLVCSALSGQGPRTGLDQQASPSSGTGLEQRPRRCSEHRLDRLRRLEKPARLAGCRPQDRHAFRRCCKPRSSSSTATKLPSSRHRPRRTSRRLSNREVSSSPTPAATAGRSTRASRRLMKELFPDPGFELETSARDHPVWRAKHLLSPDATPASGDRARLPHRRHLFSVRPFLLLEPERAQPGQPRRHQGRSRSDRMSSTTPPAARCRLTSWSSTTWSTSRPMRPSEALCESPSSSTAATGTSPPRPFPT